MSADVFVIHSSEVDDASLVRADSWYIVAGYGDVTTEDIKAGPYATNAEAYRALASGDWVYG